MNKNIAYNSSMNELLDDALLLFWDPVCPLKQKHDDDCRSCISANIPESSLLEVEAEIVEPNEERNMKYSIPSQFFMEMEFSGDEETQCADNEILAVAGPSGLQNPRKRTCNHDNSYGTGVPVNVNTPNDSELINLNDVITLTERSRRRNKKYSTEEITYKAGIIPDRIPTQYQGATLGAVVEVVRQLFEALIRRATEHLEPQDLIRFCILCDRLDKPISTALMRVDNVTTESILSRVVRVVQSKDEIALDEGFSVDVITIKRPVGAARHRRPLNLAIDCLNKRSILYIDSNKDFNLCCAEAIVLAIAHQQNHPDLKSLMRRNGNQRLRKAIALHSAAGVPEGPCGYDEIFMFEENLDVQIVVISSEHMMKVSYKGRLRSRRINLLLHDGHFDVICSLTGFYGSDMYCMECEKPFYRKSDHMCPSLCHICRSPDCKENEKMRCSECDRLCKSRFCYDLHKSSGICNEIYQCKYCCKVIRRRDCEMNRHICGTSKCPSCSEFVQASDHRCYLKKKKPQTPNGKLIFFDFETDQSTGEHNVNYAVAQYADGTTFTFEGYEDEKNNACSKFCEFLFVKKHVGFTAIAHNMKGFDGQFVIRWMLYQGKEPEVIPNGSKIMCIKVKELNLRIIDSFNFLPMGLSKMPKTFGMDELHKGYFPHLFNRPENLEYIGQLPDTQFYSPDTMSSKDRESFLKWYEGRKSTPFDFKKEIDAYCRSDVDILRRCCLEFRSQFLDAAGVDPFCYVTIASACMATFCGYHIQPNTIAMVPIRGYVNDTNFSRDGIRWLDYTAYTEGISICHALNGTGEVKIENHFVDGFCKDNNTIYQYHGCIYHGCHKCFEPETRNPVTGASMGALFEKTTQITSDLRQQGYNVIEKWEHDFLVEKRSDEGLRNFLSKHEVVDRLNPRDAFFGGRTNAIKLYYEGVAKYVDFTSLYPWTNKYCRYPVGHPLVITENFDSLESYFGMIKCKILPPRKLFHPVLPVKVNEKLMFPLCMKCATNMQQSDCNHTNDDRALNGTWITEEVTKAVAKGYKIIKIYEVYHFERSTETLFSKYIDLFLKIKQEASGWPSHCTNESQKDKYLKDYFNNEGIQLDSTAISINPGRRQVAKLALNSFWGRWGMNTNKAQLKYVSSVAEFNKILSDKTKDISDLYLPSPEIAAIHFHIRSEFQEQDTSTNIFLAAFTTGYARLKLYSEIEKLGTSVLYMDTDSIIYASDGINDPPLGDYLGDFTDEIGGEIIKTFVSGGPKNYAYETSSGKTSCKIRGFSLNFKNAKKLNFHSVKSIVQNMDKSNTIAVRNPNKITRDAKKRRIINKEETKLYRMVYDKRVIKEDFSTLPYGF